jgi:hypothetical protein
VKSEDQGGGDVERIKNYDREQVSGPISALGQLNGVRANQHSVFRKCFDWPGLERAVLEFPYFIRDEL